MQLIIHRGTHEIGGSCVEIKTSSTHIVIDIGLPLVNERGEKFESSEIKNISLDELLQKKILPRVSGLYLGDKSKEKLDALFISHSHMDHYGLCRYVKPEMPAYLSEGAKRIINISDIFLPWKAEIKNYRTLDTNKKVQLGDMAITPYLMDHSAFGTFAYLIESGGKKIFYSGDFRAHGRKRNAFLWFLKNAPQDVNCLIMEGTSLGRDDELFKSEREVEDKIVEVAKNSVNLKLALFSSQNIDRLVSFYKIAVRTNSILVIDIYTAYILDAIGGLAKIPRPDWNSLKVYYPDRQVKFLISRGYKEMIVERYRAYQVPISFIDKYRKKIILVFRDSMIEDLNKIGNLEGSVLIYSLWEGYLKEESFKSVDEFIRKNKIDMVKIHASGHATIEDLKRFAAALKPEILIPIHTFFADKYRELFTNVRVLKDGEILEI